MKQLIPVGLLIMALCACKSNSEVKFREPQPESERSLSAFNRNILGTYVNPRDSLDILIIENSLIRTRKVENHAFSRTETDSNGIAYRPSQCETSLVKGDSIFFRKVIKDTIFRIGKNQVLKKLHRNYFLNYKRYDSYWTVKMIHVDEDTLMVGEISPDTSLVQFDFVAKYDSTVSGSVPVDENDSADIDSSVIHNYILDPDRRELKKMIRAGLFETTGIYVKKKRQ
jgi:hypothetical protein